MSAPTEQQRTVMEVQVGQNQPVSYLLTALRRVSKSDFAYVSVLIFATVILWCRVYHMNSFSTWNVARAYLGDGSCNLGIIKAYRDGAINPFTFQDVPTLGAPSGGNWNDYPTSEKMLPFLIGIVARFTGLRAAFNLAGMIAVVLAAVAFLVTCRILHYQRTFSFVGAMMFGFSHYMTARFLYHLSLSYYWHLPLYLLVTWWCFDSRTLPILSSRWWIAVGIGAVTGLSAIYYALIFWQFLIFAALVHLLRRNYAKIAPILSIGAISIAFTLLMAAPHVLYEVLHGPNTRVVQRSLANLQMYALQLPDLFLPPFHRFKPFFWFAQRNFFRVTYIQGEFGSPYLGLLGIGGFLWLMVSGTTRLMAGKSAQVSIFFWQSVWILAFSLVGGVNLLLGVSGLQLFRATNRYSILLLCLALLFLICQLSRLCSPRYRVALSVFLLIGGLWDILPPFVGRADIDYLKSLESSDAAFTRGLEDSVPANTAVFQIPVMDFPEVPPRLNIPDYTYFRPYFFSTSLRFSYGADKGRAVDGWQHEIENLSPSVMADKLEQYGFGAIIVDRRGYSDTGVEMISELEAAGHRVIERDQIGEFVALRLQPRNPAIKPDIPPFAGKGFYGFEGDWRQGAHSWTDGDATLILTNSSPKAIEKLYTFALSSITPRHVTVITPTQRKTFDVDANHIQSAGPFTLQLPPGETSIRFTTDLPSALSGDIDSRPLAFAVGFLGEQIKEAVPVLDSNFYGFEGDWRKGAHTWSKGSATLNLQNTTGSRIDEWFTFVVSAPSQRRVVVVTPIGTKSIDLTPGSGSVVGPFKFRLDPGDTPIRFETDRAAVLAGPQDPRRIAFSVVVVPETGVQRD